jgi:putative isomerase
VGRRDLPPMRQWNTWQAEHPLAFRHVPSGLTWMPGLYSTRLGRGTDLAVADIARGEVELRLGEHDPQGRYVAAEAAFAGTRIAFEWAKADAFTWVARSRWLAAGEWPLRYWLLWALEFAGGGPEPEGKVRLGEASYDLGRGRAAPGPGWAGRGDGAHLRAAWRSQALALVSDPPPLAAGLHPSLRDLLDEMARDGYFAPRGDGGPTAILRYNGEECPVSTFALGTGHDDDAALRRARAALAAADEIIAAGRRALASGPRVVVPALDGAVEAVRDVVSWNTVWDEVNARPFTTLTRNWVAKKFGGWFVWLDDVLEHGLLAALAGDAALARRNVETALYGQTPDGNLPCLVAENTEWVDRSQPPLAAFLTDTVMAWADDPALAREAYPILREAYEWWFTHRDPTGAGLISYGTSATGSGMFVGTALAARDESAMDNSPMYDGVPLDPVARTLRLFDVAPSSLLVLEGESLARIARAAGDAAGAQAAEARARTLAERVRNDLWNERRALFQNRRWPVAGSAGDDPWPKATSPTSFLPLLAGIATAEQARRMVEEHLRVPERFGGEPMLPATARDEPGYGDQVYWRGRVWPPLVLLTYLGLRRYGFEDDARRLADSSLAMFAREWGQRRHCHENYSGESGEGDDGYDSDPFYTWGALIPAIGLLEVVCWTPWDGLTLGSADGRGLAEGVRLLGRTWDVRPGGNGDGVRVAVDGRERLACRGANRLYDVRLEPDEVAVGVRSAEGELWVDLADSAWVGEPPPGARLEPDADGAGTVVRWLRADADAPPLRLHIRGRAVPAARPS